MLRNKKFPLFVFSFIIILVLVVSFLNFKINSTRADVLAPASSDTVLYGSAWAPNLGYISFNSCSDITNASTCGAIAYQVKVLPNKTLNGWAWSDNAGWILFGDGTPYTSAQPIPTGPDASGKPISGATVTLNNDGTIKTITGWAKAINGTPNSVNGVFNGWDGLISFNDISGNNYYATSGGLSASIPNGTSTMRSQALANYTWGSAVVGYVDMSNVKVGKNMSAGTITLFINGNTNPVTVASGENFSLSATGVNLDPTKDCNATTPPVWTGSKTVPNPNASYGAMSLTNNTGSAVTYHFSLSCTDLLGNNIASNIIDVIVNPAPQPPVLTFTADKYTIPSGSSVNLTWSVTNPANSNPCTPQNGTANWRASSPLSASSTFGTEPLSANTNFRISCKGIDGSTVSSSLNITVLPNHCFNKVQDSNETGLDCGGDCPPCSTCNGGVLTPQKAGTNCDIPGCPACSKKPHYIER